MVFYWFYLWVSDGGDNHISNKDDSELMSTLLCEAVDRAFKNQSKSCLLCYNFKLIKDKLMCPYDKERRGVSIEKTLHNLMSYARRKAKDCKEYDGEC